MKKLKKWLLLILWMIIIYLFSNQPNSGQITHNIIEVLITNSTYSITNIINFIIRKTAHITEYFILALLTISLLKEYIKNPKKIIITTIFFCYLYALSDEFHQALVPGRSGVYTDVLIDTLGCLIAVIIYILLLKKRNPLLCGNL